MVYKGINLKGYLEIIDYALKLEGKEQEEFVETFAHTGPYALQNVGYYSGYFPEDKAKQILEVFKTAHPIFGRLRPSPEQALEMGKALGEKAKRDA